MDLLRRFDFQETFNLHEITSLCLGLDPARDTALDSAAQAVALRAIEKAVMEASTSGSAECCRVHFDAGSIADLTNTLLYPRWCMARLPAEPGMPAWEEISRDRWPEQGFDPGPLADWTFHRSIVVAWVKAKGFIPGYQFDKSGGAPGQTDELLRLARAIERAGREAESRQFREQAMAGFARIHAATRPVGLKAEKGQRLKRAALIAAFVGEWPTIERDLRDASENGLSSAAKADKHGYWWGGLARRWAEEHGKLSPTPALPPSWSSRTVIKIAG